MGADAVVIRHGASGAPHRLATSGWIDAAVVNAGDGTHEHPTQALLDAFTMRRRLVGGDAGIGQDLAGSASRSSATSCTAGSPAPTSLLLHTLGAEVTLVAPPTLLPVGVEHLALRGVATTSTSTLPKADAVMMLRVQRERMNAAFFPTEREYSRRYGLDGDRMATDARARHRDAPRPDDPRHGDHRRGRRLRALHRRRAGRQRRLHPDGRPLPAARRDRARRQPRTDAATEEK